MEAPSPDWKILPAEILYLIFNFAEYKQLCNLTLVCKTWLNPAQLALYSSIRITKPAQLKKFYKTVENNKYLGEMVKYFSVQINSGYMSYEDPEETFHYITILLSAYLPYLETFEGFNIDFYSAVLNALNNSQLKHLRGLPSPVDVNIDKEIENYVKCAFLMKDRIDRLYLWDKSICWEDEYADSSSFFPLYKELSQFGKLKEIHLIGNTNKEIQILEHVIESCKYLNGALFYFLPHKASSTSENNSMPINAIKSFIPRPNIKTLTIDINMPRYSTILTYMMHKFPQLCELFLQMKNNSNDTFDQHILSQLLFYLSEINVFSATDLSVDSATIADTIENYLNTKSRVGDEYFKICYSRWLEGTKPVLDISKSINSEDSFIKITYPLPDHDIEELVIKHAEFIEKNGKFVQELLFTMGTHSSDISEDMELPSEFFTNIFTYCTKLEYLYFSRCILKSSKQPEHNLCKKTFLKELYLDRCLLYADTLEHLSLSVPEISLLRISTITYIEYDIRHGYIDIIMPYTKIDTIIFESYIGTALLLKVFVHNDKCHYFYLQSTSTTTNGTFHEINQVEYFTIEGRRLIYVHCLTKPKFQIGVSEMAKRVSIM